MLNLNKLSDFVIRVLNTITDTDHKKDWILRNQHKSVLWTLRMPLEQIKSIAGSYSPDVCEIADWFILHNDIKVKENRFCFNPMAFCWSSGKLLFLKRSIIVHTSVDVIGDNITGKFYFDPSQYTLWLLKNK